jgi:uncharacterized protein YggE
MVVGKRSRLLACVAVVSGALAHDAQAQVSGSFGGRGQASRPETGRLGVEEAGSFIAIEGSCELRVAAEGLRVVFAIATDAATPTECWAKQRTHRAAFVDALAAAGLAGDAVQVDFISMLPVYDWKQESRDGQAVLVERLAGHRLQENVHVAVADEEGARAAIELALSKEVHDVIAVEYWSRQTAAKRREALESALAAAKAKADLLLAAFEKRPPLANVQERTDVLTPDRLYASFENVYAGEVETDWQRGLPRLRAPRPKNTFYAGFDGAADVALFTARMKPELSVVSTVVLYFESPSRATTPPKETQRR